MGFLRFAVVDFALVLIAELLFLANAFSERRSMAKRIHILLNDRELARIKRAARGRMSTIAGWIRQAIRDALRLRTSGDRSRPPKGVIFRMKTVAGMPDDVDLGTHLFRDVVSRCCLEVGGFLAGYFLVDRRSGRTVTLSLWSDDDALGEGLRNLHERMQADERAAAIAARINARGVRFDTFELAFAVERADPRGLVALRKRYAAGSKVRSTSLFSSEPSKAAANRRKRRRSATLV